MATTTRSTSSAVTPASSSAASAAAVASVVVLSASPARRRLAMPVRRRIQASSTPSSAPTSALPTRALGQRGAEALDRGADRHASRALRDGAAKASGRSTERLLDAGRRRARDVARDKLGQDATGARVDEVTDAGVVQTRPSSRASGPAA